MSARQIKRTLLHWMCLFSLMAGLPSLARGEDKTDPKPADEKLRQDLLQRMQEDQQVRKQVMEYLDQHPGTDSDALKNTDIPLMKKMRQVDRRNTRRLKEILEHHGWPGKTLVGKDGAQAAWLLVQHADLDPAFQKRCLTLIIEAVKKGEVSPENMAYLTDRVRVADKQKQVYGTQFHLVNGNYEPNPIEDEANVDKRRKEVGLPPLAEYRQLMQSMFKSKPGAKP